MLELQGGGDEYSLLVNLKRLYDLQLSRAVPIESVYGDIVKTLQNFRSLEDEVCEFSLCNKYKLYHSTLYFSVTD